MPPRENRIIDFDLGRLGAGAPTGRHAEIERDLFAPPAIGPRPEDDHDGPPIIGAPAPGAGARASAGPPALDADSAPAKLGFSLRGGLRERLRARRAQATAGEHDQDDPFAALLSPLSEADLDQLRREVEADTVVIYERVHRRRRAESFARSGGLILGIAATAGLGPLWRTYFAALRDTPPPARAMQHLERVPQLAEHADIATYAIGAMVPVLFLICAVQAITEILRALAHPGVRSVIAAALLGCASAVGAFLIIDPRPLAAALTLCASAIIGAFIGPRQRGGRANGSPRR